MSDKIYGDSLGGVGCDVSNCKYHSMKNECTAPRINVQNESAIRKAETFCGTFAPRSSNESSMSSGNSKSGSASASNSKKGSAGESDEDINMTQFTLL